MKTRIFFVIAAVLVFGLGIATFAYKQTSSTKAAAAACCCKGDSCPMKTGKAEHKMAADHKMAGEEGHKCCGDSCPMMKKKDGETKVSAASASEEGKNCCDNCDCCGDKAKAKTSTV